MTVDEIVREIKLLSISQWDTDEMVPVEQVNWLVSLASEDYKRVVQSLLQAPVVDNEHLRGHEYLQTYVHCLYGCLLFAFRPAIELYSLALTGTLGIGDPSSIQYGALALRQVKPVEQIVLDLLATAEQNMSQPSRLSPIAWVFYWLGYSSYGGWRPVDGPIRVGNLAPMWVDRTVYDTDHTKALELAPQITRFMQLYYALD